MLTLRTADNRDIDKVRTLVRAVLREYGMELDSAGVDADLDDIEANYTASGGWFGVVEDTADRMVGTTGLLRVDNRVCELRKMYLESGLRGRGWGKTLLDRTLRKAGEMGFREIRLETASALIEAIGLYGRAGFSPAPGRDGETRCDRAFFMPLVEYRKPEGLRELKETR